MGEEYNKENNEINKVDKNYCHLKKQTDSSIQCTM